MIVDAAEITARIRAILPPARLPNAAPFVVEVLELREFRRQAARAGAANAEAYYDPRTRRVMLADDTWCRNLPHEVVHAVMDVDHACTEPNWFCEGAAVAIEIYLKTGAWPEAKRDSAIESVSREGLYYAINFDELYKTCAGHVTYLLRHEPSLFHRRLWRAP